MKLKQLMRGLLFGLLALSILLGAGLTSLMYTEAGARWAWSQLTAATGDSLGLDHLQGTLAGGLEIHGLRMNTPTSKTSVVQTRIRSGIDWFPMRLVIHELELRGLDIGVSPGPAASTSPRRASPDLTPLMDVLVERARALQLTIHEIGQEPLFGPLDIELSGLWSDELTISHLGLQGAGVNAKLQGRLQLEAPYQHQLQSSLTLPEEWRQLAGLESAGFTLQAVGEQGHSQITARHAADQLEVRLGIGNWLEQLSWTLEIGAGGWSHPGAAAAGVHIEAAAVRAHGDMESYSFEGSGALHAFDLPFELILSGSGDRGSLQMESSSLNADALQMGMRGTVNWQDTVAARISAEISHLNPGIWLDTWPAKQPVSGAVELSWSPGNLELPQFSLKLAGSEASLNGSASWQSAPGRANAHVQWSQWQWPLDAKPRVASRSGRLELTGIPEDWLLNGEFDVQAGEYPPAQLSLSGAGDTRSARLALAHGEFLGGAVNGKVMLDWRTGLSWQADLSMARVGLAPLWPDWPAILDADIGLAQAPAPGSFQLQIRRLDGTLRGEPIAGAGRLEFGPGKAHFEQLSLTAPGSSILLDGDLETGLLFSVEASRPGLLARLTGAEVSGRGRVRRVADHPEVELDLTVKNLQREDVHIGELSIQGTAGPGLPGAALHIAASRAGWGGANFDSAKASLVNTQAGHALSVEAQAGAQSLLLGTSGVISGWQAPAGLTWDGELTALTLQLDGHDVIELVGGARLHASPASLALDQACVRVDASGEACFDAQWRTNRSLRLQASLAAIPLQSLAQFTDLELSFSQLIDGTLEWSQATAQRPSGRARIDLSAGVIEPLEDSREPVRTGPGTFGFELDAGHLSQGRLQLPFPGLGDIDLDFSIADLALDGTGQLGGRARIDIDELALLALFVPGLEPVSGHLEIDTRLSGLTASPHLEGQFLLENAVFKVPALGLTNVNLSLAGQVSRNDTLTAHGSLASGSGRAEVRALLQVGQWDNPAFQLEIQGTDLTALEVPSLQVTVDPDLKLGWRNGQWTIDGQLAIPVARIAPANSIAGRISASNDVEIVAGHLPVGPVPSATESAPVNGKVRLLLGDGVNIDMPAVQMSASGNIDLDWRGEILPMATGLLLLDGEIRTYGPRLRVEQGRVRFQNQTLDDPVLDIRAERDIFGNTRIQAAGVRIGGTARRPQIQAYTNPLTTEERAWTLLVTGSDFEYGQGVGAFDIGTYVSPRLYISYGISLFDDERQVGARYDLKKGFGIKATSSHNDNGVDVSYTIER